MDFPQPDNAHPVTDAAPLIFELAPRLVAGLHHVAGPHDIMHPNTTNVKPHAQHLLSNLTLYCIQNGRSDIINTTFNAPPTDMRHCTLQLSKDITQLYLHMARYIMTPHAPPDLLTLCVFADLTNFYADDPHRCALSATKSHTKRVFA